MFPAVVLDPATLTWDANHFAANRHDYWALAAELMVLFDTLESKATTVVLGSDLAAELVNDFPAAEINDVSAELRDFVRVVFSFLSKACEGEFAYPTGTVANCIPDVVSRTHFSADLTEHFHRALLHAGRLTAKACYFATHPLVWTWHETELKFHDGQHGRNLQRMCGSAAFEEYRDSDLKIYQASFKHHPVSGFGSKLPKSLVDADYQQLLDRALEVNPATFCAFSRKAGVYLVFRCHHKNYFHGYPILWSELSKLGVSSKNVPRI